MNAIKKLYYSKNYKELIKEYFLKIKNEAKKIIKKLRIAANIITKVIFFIFASIIACSTIGIYFYLLIIFIAFLLYDA